MRFLRLSRTFLPSCVVFFRLAACFSFVCFRWNELELLPMPLLIYLLSPFLSLIVSIHLVTSLIQSVLRLHFHRCRPHKLWFWLIGFLRDNPPSRHCVVLNNTYAIPPFCSFHWKMSFVRANRSTAANFHQKSFFPVLYFSPPHSHWFVLSQPFFTFALTQSVLFNAHLCTASIVSLGTCSSDRKDQWPGQTWLAYYF